MNSKTVATTFSVDNPPAAAADGHLVPSKGRIIKNASILSIAVMLYLSANLPCSELQSSINIEGGLGVYAETVNNFVSIFASITLPTLFVNKMGLKHTISFSLAIITLYYFANLKPSFWTMIPAAAISSMANAPLWPAKASYLIILSEQWSKAYHTNLDATISQMFGFFYSFYYFGYIWGNVASYFILQPAVEAPALSTNETSKCGLYFCDWDAVGDVNFVRPPDNEIYTLFGLFIGITWVGALIVVFFLDHFTVSGLNPNESVLYLLVKTLRAMLTPKHLILLPLSVLRGVSIAFLSTEYTKSFVTCGWGIHNIGLVMISFGIVCGSASLFFGRLVKYTGRLPLFTTALILHLVVALVVSFWKPTAAQTYLYFLVPCLQGICNAVWESQVAALYALIFPNDRDVIFSIYNVAEGVGGTIARAYSSIICTQYKLCMYMCFVAMGFTSYVVSEFKYLRKK